MRYAMRLIHRVCDDRSPEPSARIMTVDLDFVYGKNSLRTNGEVITASSAP
jgi:hypothetical protein